MIQQLESLRLTETFSKIKPNIKSSVKQLLLIISINIVIALETSAEFGVENEEPVHSSDKRVSISKILDHYFTAKGGFGKMLEVTSIVSKNTLTIDGKKNFVRIVKKRPNKYKISYQVEEGENLFVYCYNGNTGWRTIGNSKSNVELLNDGETQNLIELTDFYSYLFNYMEKGVQLRFIGMSRVNGIDTYKIKAIINKNKTIYYYIDEENYDLRIALTREVKANEIAITKKIFGDYKRVDGILMAHKIVSYKRDVYKQTLIVNEYKFNSGILDYYFDMPR